MLYHLNLITVYLPGAMSQNIYINFKNEPLELLIKAQGFRILILYLKKLKILKIHDILHLNQLKFYNKFLNNQLPEYFDSFSMPRNCTYHNYNTRHCQIIRPFRPKREFCKKCLRYNLPEIMSSFGCQIIYSKPLNVFCMLMRIYLHYSFLCIWYFFFLTGCMFICLYFYYVKCLVHCYYYFLNYKSASMLAA